MRIWAIPSYNTASKNTVDVVRYNHQETIL